MDDTRQRSPAFEAGRRAGEVIGLAGCALGTGLLIAIAVLVIIGAFSSL